MTHQKAEQRDRSTDDVVWKAALAAIALGVLVTAYLILETQSESYSALYIKPDSYSNYLNASSVSFVYGVQCFENAATDYGLKVYLGDVQVAGKSFVLEGRGRVLEDAVSFEVPGDLKFPAKVMLVLTANGRDYSTHFWLKGRA